MRVDRRVVMNILLGGVALSIALWFALSQKNSHPNVSQPIATTSVLAGPAIPPMPVPQPSIAAVTPPPSVALAASNPLPDTPVDPAETNVTISTLKQVLDRSMADDGAVYVGYQLLSSPTHDQGIASFVYRDGESPALSLDELAEISDRSSDKQDEGRRLMEEARRDGDQDRMRAAARLQVDGDREFVQEDGYMTVELSTTMHEPPVLMFQRGLPDWVVYSRTGATLAEQSLSGELTLVEVTRSVPGSPTIFTYQDSLGATVYVDPINEQVFTSRQLVPAPRRSSDNRDATAMQERATRVGAQWDEFLRDGIDIGQFSLDDLRDLTKER